MGPLLSLCQLLQNCQISSAPQLLFLRCFLSFSPSSTCPFNLRKPPLPPEINFRPKRETSFVTASNHVDPKKRRRKLRLCMRLRRHKLLLRHPGEPREGQCGRMQPALQVGPLTLALCSFCCATTHSARVHVCVSTGWFNECLNN